MKFNHQNPEATQEAVSTETQQPAEESMVERSAVFLNENVNQIGMPVSDVDQYVTALKEAYVQAAVCDAMTHIDSVAWIESKGRCQLELSDIQDKKVSYTAFYSKVTEFVDEENNPKATVEKVYIDGITVSVTGENETVDMALQVLGEDHRVVLTSYTYSATKQEYAQKTQTLYPGGEEMVYVNSVTTDEKSVTEEKRNDRINKSVTEFEKETKLIHSAYYYTDDVLSATSHRITYVEFKDSEGKMQAPTLMLLTTQGAESKVFYNVIDGRSGYQLKDPIQEVLNAYIDDKGNNLLTDMPWSPTVVAIFESYFLAKAQAAKAAAAAAV